MKEGKQRLFFNPSSLLLFLCLALASLLAYLPVFSAGYTNWDDPSYTFRNRSVQGLSAAGLKKVLTDTGLANYHPATMLSIAAENALFGEKAAVHHSVNLLLHALNSFLVFALLLALFGRRLTAFAAALVWALHPANVESVAWIAERKNLLYAFFYLSALLSYLRRLAGGGRKYYTAALALCLLALLSKAAAVTLPLALLLLEAMRPGTSPAAAARRTAPFFVLAALFTALSVALQSSEGRIVTARAPALLSFYLIKSVWPAALSAVYPYKELLEAFGAFQLTYLFPALLFAAAFCRAWLKNRPAAWGLAFFAVHILPYVSLIPVGGIIAADRYLYLPLAGLAWAAAAAARSFLPDTPPARKAALAALALAALAAGSAASARARVWNSSMTLWTDTLSKYPGDITANLNMGHALLELGRREKAAGHYLKVLQANPGQPDALYNLGTLYGQAGRHDEALELLGRAVRAAPGNAMAWNNLGLVLHGRRRLKDARHAFAAAMAADPEYAPAHANLAETEAALGDCAAARGHFDRALALGFPAGAAGPGDCR